MVINNFRYAILCNLAHFADIIFDCPSRKSNPNKDIGQSTNDKAAPRPRANRLSLEAPQSGQAVSLRGTSISRQRRSGWGRTLIGLRYFQCRDVNSRGSICARIESGKNSGVLCGSEQRRGWLKDRVEGQRRQVGLVPEPLS